jgi:hypothetical protein
MKITSEKADNIIEDPKTRKNWIFFAENLHGSVYWNKVTGEILWRADEDDESTFDKPKKAK